ncbi:protein of unknown function [Hyphomicrobium sp. MC1]|nr:protein of unknown function [Hyphomicrobium sp. MC1]
MAVDTRTTEKRAGNGAFLVCGDSVRQDKVVCGLSSLQIVLCTCLQAGHLKLRGIRRIFLRRIELAKRFDANLRLRLHEIWLNTRPNVHAGGRTDVFEFI